MKILALEFSSSQRSAAVVLGAARPEIVTEVVETGGPPTRPFAMIEEALRQAGIEREQVECVVVGIGPGSYTGIRAAISIAQGWQLARPIRILGISSAEGIAAQAQADGAMGRMDVIVDAQRDELYLATYELTHDSCREIEALKIVTMAEARLRAEAGGVLIGPEVSRWFATGKTVFPRAATLGTL